MPVVISIMYAMLVISFMFHGYLTGGAYEAFRILGIAAVSLSLGFLGSTRTRRAAPWRFK